MRHSNNSRDCGPLGRSPTVARVFDSCPCGASTRNGLCEDMPRHGQWQATQEQQRGQSQPTAQQS